MASHLSTFCVFLFLFLLLPVSLAKLILEEGYTVTTVIDGHGLKINPYAVLSGHPLSDLILLDSSRSTFYTLSFPISDESVINRLSGDEVAGLSDGEPGSARFNKPKSFTIDRKGNIYVADRINGTIRKITKSGVTTIAGGYSRGLGHEDGPAQNATFSNDFQVAFIAEECALLISDHGNQLLRRIGLKPEDCEGGGSGSQYALGAVSFWVLGLVFSCLLGFVFGFVIRPYIVAHGGSSYLKSNKTWKLSLMNPVEPVLMRSFGIRNAVANSRLCALMRRLLCLSLSHLSLVLKINYVGFNTSGKGIGSQTASKAFVSLLDSDVNSVVGEKSRNELEDLISFSSPSQLYSSKAENEVLTQEEKDCLRSDVLLDGHRRIDTMIQANIVGFAMVAEETTPLNESLIGSTGLVKRR